MRFCASCKGKPNIKTTAFYCQNCFLSVLERKIRAVLRSVFRNECEILKIENDFKKLDHGSSENLNVRSNNIELLIQIKYKQDCALAFLLSEMLHEHALSHVKIEIDGIKKSVLKQNTEKQNKLENEKKNEKSKITTFYLTRYTKEDLATLIIDCMIENKFNDMSKYCSDGYFLESHNLNVINILKSVTDKEISVFLYLKQKQFQEFLENNQIADKPTFREDSIVQPDSLHQNVPLNYKMFILQMSKKNRSTCGNVIETVFKGIKEQNR